MVKVYPFRSMKGIKNYENNKYTVSRYVKHELNSMVFLRKRDSYCFDSRPVHTVRLFLIATAILLITTNGLSHYATVTTSPTPNVAHYNQKQPGHGLDSCKFGHENYLFDNNHDRTAHSVELTFPKTLQALIHNKVSLCSIGIRKMSPRSCACFIALSAGNILYSTSGEVYLLRVLLENRS